MVLHRSTKSETSCLAVVDADFVRLTPAVERRPFVVKLISFCPLKRHGTATGTGAEKEKKEKKEKMQLDNESKKMRHTSERFLFSDKVAMEQND